MVVNNNCVRELRCFEVEREIKKLTIWADYIIHAGIKLMPVSHLLRYTQWLQRCAAELETAGSNPAVAVAFRWGAKCKNDRVLPGTLKDLNPASLTAARLIIT